MEERPNTSNLRNTFIRTSPFPVLRRPELKSIQKRNITLSNVRIAPPERVNFQANSRSNILRSGSLVSLQNATRSDNEPLNPSSGSDIEAVPTRSVLDALKEISRKRINNEELDAERIKKQCKDISEVDSPTNLGNLMYRTPGILTKRPRELGPSSPQNGETDKQKKRLCTKNNEVLSSYSSSISLTTPRRQLKELYIKKTLDLDKQPPPDTPIVSQTSVIRQVSSLPIVVHQPKPVYHEIIAPINVPKPIVKAASAPKITLFNKKYDTTPIKIPENDDSLSSDEEISSIQFVKPKENNPAFKNGTDFLLRNVEKSKLSILLKCLAGEIDDDSKDMVDSSKLTEKKVENGLETTEPKDTVDKPLTSVAALIKPVQSVPVLNFTQPVTSVSTDSATPKLTFGTPATTSTSNLANLTTSAPTYTFGTATTSVSLTNQTSGITTPAVITSIAPESSQPSLPPSSFGAIKTILTSTSNILPSSTSSVTVTEAAKPAFSIASIISSAPSFNFGSSNNTVQGASSNNIATTGMPSFGFGSNQLSQNIKKTEENVSSKSTLPIFGSSFASTTSPPTIASIGEYFFHSIHLSHFLP